MKNTKVKKIERRNTTKREVQKVILQVVHLTAHPAMRVKVQQTQIVETKAE
jgi:hypothetical protein